MLRTLAIAILIATATATGATPPARAQSGPFGHMLGTWKGTGELKLEGGKSEQMRCSAYYTARDSGGLGLAIRCASASYTIELRSNLKNEAGGLVSGNWEERTFNTSGVVKGKADSGNLKLTIDGGGFTGTVSVETNGSSQTVSMKTTGNPLQGVSIQLNKG